MVGLAVMSMLNGADRGSPAIETLVRKGALISLEQAQMPRLEEWKRQGFVAIALMLTGSDGEEELQAARAIRDAGLELDYWIEIARNSALADAHPEWMASIQTHEEWRRFFPDVPRPKTGEVVKVYPWVPVLYEETFKVHLQRVESLLSRMPTPRRLFLNDLQGAPSACGCGHPLCRWTTDYGPLKTATRSPDNAAAKFVVEMKQRLPDSDVVPIWTTECEAHDKDGLCGGVGCFNGACWREWTAQLTPLAAEAGRIGALLPYRAFDRDLAVYGKPAGWVADALTSFQTMPAKYGSQGVGPNRLIAVVQGWSVSPEQVKAQMARSMEAGGGDMLVSFAEIEQSWEPRIIPVKSPPPSSNGGWPVTHGRGK